MTQPRPTERKSELLAAILGIVAAALPWVSDAKAGAICALAGIYVGGRSYVKGKREATERADKPLVTGIEREGEQHA